MNGVAVTVFPVTLHTGDTLAITTTSSASNNTPTFVTVTFGGQQYIVTFVTAAPYSNVFDTDMYAVPFYQRTNTDGTVYNSTVHTYSVAVNGVITEKQTTAPPTGISSTLYQVMVLDPYNDEAHLVGSDGSLVATYTIPDATWTGATVYNVGKFTFWFGFFHKNQVGITLDGTNFTYLNFSSSPVAITTNSTGSYIWVACYDGSLFCFRQNGALVFNQVAQVKIATTPTSIAMDDSGNVYVVSMTSTSLVKYSPNGTSLGSVPVGNMPIGIAYVNSQIFVSCAEDQTIVALQSGNLAQTGAITLTEFPGLITVDPTNTNLCITCLSSTNVYRYKSNSSLALVDKTTFSKPVLAAYSFDTNIIADHLQYDARPYTRSLVSKVPGLGFFENDQEPISTVVQSTIVTAIRLETNTPISIPSNLGASIVLNGTNIGTSGTVKANDRFYITFTTPSTGNVFTQVPVVVGNYVEPWNTTTATVITAPNPFTFAPINTSANNQVSTSIVTIAGLTPGTSVAASSTGTVLKNGQVQSGPFSVVNGDTIQLQTTSSVTTGAVVQVSVTVGTYSTLWSVFTNQAITPVIQTLIGQQVNTVVTSTPFTYNGTNTVATFPTNVTVKVNGSVISSGTIITSGSNIVVSGTTSAQTNQTSTFAVTLKSGAYYALQATTVPNVVPYPMDFGVIYDAAPGSLYETLDVTAQNIDAAATLELLNAGSFLINDGDTQSNIVTINNGAVMGLMIRGQASAKNAMYTIPIYALALDGVTQVACGSVRVVPLVLKGSIDYPYEGHEENTMFRFFRYREGVYLEATNPVPKVSLPSTIGSGITLTSQPVLLRTNETGLTYATKYTSAMVRSTGLAYNTVDETPKTYQSSYSYTTVYDMADVYESGYHFVMYDGTNPYHETDYGQQFYQNKNTSSVTAVPAVYQDMKFSPGWVVVKNIPSPASPVIGNGYQVKMKYQIVKNNVAAAVKVKVQQLKYGDQTSFTLKVAGNLNNTVAKYTVGVNPVLPVWWMSGMPVPQMIENFKILTDMPLGILPPGCMHGSVPLPGSVYEIAKMVEADAPVPLFVDSAHDGDSPARSPSMIDNVGMAEMGSSATQVSIVNVYEVDSGLTAVPYTEEMSPSIQNDPTLYGGFADKASAQQFITDNNIHNATLIQLSNGYWMIVTTTAMQDLSCAIAPPPGTPGTLRSVGWLLQGG